VAGQWARRYVKASSSLGGLAQCHARPCVGAVMLIMIAGPASQRNLEPTQPKPRRVMLLCRGETELAALPLGGRDSTTNSLTDITSKYRLQSSCLLWAGGLLATEYNLLNPAGKGQASRQEGVFYLSQSPRVMQPF
jgi:hypothetical protein